MSYSTNIASLPQTNSRWVLEIVGPSDSTYFSTGPVTGLTGEVAIIQKLVGPSIDLAHTGGSAKVTSISCDLIDVYESDGVARKATSRLYSNDLTGGFVRLHHGYESGVAADHWVQQADGTGGPEWKVRWCGYLTDLNWADGKWTLRAEDPLSKAKGNALPLTESTFIVGADANAGAGAVDGGYYAKDKFMPIKKLINFPEIVCTELPVTNASFEDATITTAWTASASCTLAKDAGPGGSAKVGSRTARLSCAANPGYIYQDITLPVGGSIKPGTTITVLVFAKATVAGKYARVDIETRGGGVIKDFSTGALRLVRTSQWGAHSASIQVDDTTATTLRIKLYASTSGGNYVYFDDVHVYVPRTVVSVKRELYSCYAMEEATAAKQYLLHVGHGVLGTRENSQQKKQKGKAVKVISGQPGDIILRLLTSTPEDQRLVDSPSLSLIATPNSGTAPLSVTFTASVTGGSSPYVFGWDFGDGETSSTQSPTHSYAAEGTYLAKCTVMDSEGLTDQKYAAIIVDAGFSVSCVPDNSSGIAPWPVQFTCTANGGVSPFNWGISYGDGNDDTSIGTVSPHVFTHTYHTPGTKTVWLQVTDSAAAYAVTSLTVVVYELPIEKGAEYTGSISPWDHGDGYGCGIPIELFDTDSFAYLRNEPAESPLKMGGLHRLAFVIDKPIEDALGWIEENVLRPIGAWLYINKDGLIAIRYLPWPDTYNSGAYHLLSDTVASGSGNLLAGKATLSRVPKDTVNAIEWSMDYDQFKAVVMGTTEPPRQRDYGSRRDNTKPQSNYAGFVVFNEADYQVTGPGGDKNLSSQGRGYHPYKVSSKGVRSHVSYAIGMPCPLHNYIDGYTYTQTDYTYRGETMGRSLAERLMRYYSTPPCYITYPAFAQAFEWEPGATIRISTLYVPDLSTGAATITAGCWGILLGKNPNLDKMTVSLRIAIVDWCEDIPDNITGSLSPPNVDTITYATALIDDLKKGNFELVPTGKFSCIKAVQTYESGKAGTVPQDAAYHDTQLEIDWMPSGDDTIGYIVCARFRSGRYLMSVNGTGTNSDPWRAYNIRARYRCSNGYVTSGYDFTATGSLGITDDINDYEEGY